MGEFDGQVAIVTGAGAGLGRAHALALAAEGARVVVNDIAAALPAGERLAAEITAAGGTAVAEAADVSDAAQVGAMVGRVLDLWGRIDVLICNAGILRDRSFAKMDMADFALVLAVHLQGSANCCHAVWEPMRAQGYGRILLTTSSSGLYGNFGQVNYGAAKAGMIGLMNSLHQEGVKYDIRVNCLSPTAATSMTAGLLSPEDEALLGPAAVAPAALFLTARQAPSRTIMGAGAGVYSVVRIEETEGLWLPPEERTAQGIAARFARIGDRATARELPNAFAQTQKYVAMARKALGG